MREGKIARSIAQPIGVTNRQSVATTLSEKACQQRVRQPEQTLFIWQRCDGMGCQVYALADTWPTVDLPATLFFAPLLAGINVARNALAHKTFARFRNGCVRCAYRIRLAILLWRLKLQVIFPVIATSLRKVRLTRSRHPDTP